MKFSKDDISHMMGAGRQFAANAKNSNTQRVRTIVAQKLRGGSRGKSRGK